jgi:hypothetical protein
MSLELAEGYRNALSCFLEAVSLYRGHEREFGSDKTAEIADCEARAALALGSLWTYCEGGGMDNGEMYVKMRRGYYQAIAAASAYAGLDLTFPGKGFAAQSAECVELAAQILAVAPSELVAEVERDAAARRPSRRVQGVRRPKA